MTLAAAIELFFVYALHLLTLTIPFAASAAWAVRRSQHIVTVVAAGLLAVGFGGMVVFWTYLANPLLGRATAIAVLSLSGLAIALFTRDRDVRCRLRKAVGLPWIYYAATSLLILALGYSWGGTDKGGEIPANRFLASLPVDHDLPLMFAEHLRSAVRPLPKYIDGDWQFSDRPPLQSGIYLLENAPFNRPDYIDYEVAGVLAQSLWIFGVWALLVGFGASPRLQAACLALTTFSGFTILNTFFTWPKLLPAAFLMILCAATLTPARSEIRGSGTYGAVVGGSLGCAMLGHPGSAFAALGVAMTLALVRWVPKPRFVAWSIVMTAVLYLPWMLFQRLYNPPGTKLEQYQLADTPFPRESTRRAVVHAYERVGLEGAWTNKKSNFGVIWDWARQFPGDVGSLLSAAVQGRPVGALAQEVRVDVFFGFFPVWGLLALGPIALLIRVAADRLRGSGWPAPRETQFVFVSILALVLNVVIWALVLFGPGATLLHQGSYLVPLLGIVAGATCWWLASRALLLAITIVQSALTMWIYAILPPPGLSREDSSFSGEIARAMVALELVGLVGCLVVLAWLSFQRAPFTNPADKAPLRR